MIREEFYPKYPNEPQHQLYINGESLPYKFKLESSGDISVRSKTEKRAYSHGSTLTGDGYIDGKTIKLTFHISGTNQDDYNAKVNNLYAKLYATDYKLSVGNETYWNVAGLSKITSKFIEGYQFMKADVTASLLLSDPFRYGSLHEELIDVDVPAKELEFKINNIGSVMTPLIFTFIPSATMNDITVKHVETGKSMRIADTLLTNPATLTVDTKAGTVRRDTYNAINFFSGQFLTAETGENTYKLTCAVGKVKINWIDRWLA